MEREGEKDFEACFVEIARARGWRSIADAAQTGDYGEHMGY